MWIGGAPVEIALDFLGYRKAAAFRLRYQPAQTGFAAFGKGVQLISGSPYDEAK